MLNERMLKVFELLSKAAEGVSGETLARRLGVSSRTIRSDVKGLDAYLRGCGAAVRSTTRAGYSLEILDAAAFERSALHRQARRPGLESAQARVRQIMERLLSNALRGKAVTQMELADELFVSLSTLKQHLKDVEKRLARFGLKIAAYKARGIRVEGEEARLRYCISELLFDRQEEEAAYKDAFYREVFQQIDMQKLENLIRDVLEKRRLRLTDTALQNLLVHVAIAMQRAGADHAMVYAVSQTRALEGAPELSVARLLLEEIYQQLGVDLAAGEMYYLAQHLIASKKFFDEALPQEAFCLSELFDKIAARINEAVGIDFSGDENLRRWLSLHLKVALPRMRFQMNIRNEVLEVIKSEYPLAFQIAVIASRLIEAEEHVRVNEHEIGFIAIHFGAALSRKGILPLTGAKQALIVCATGVGTAILLRTKLEAHFKERLQVAGLVSGYELTEEMLSGVDVVLTTVPIVQLQSDKIVRVTHLLNAAEIAEIERRVFFKLADGRLLVEEFFREDCFYRDMPLKSRREVLDFLTREMVAKGLMYPSTRDSVFEREAASPTEIGNLVAIPHPMCNDTPFSSIAVLLLEKPILWEAQQVQVVLLIHIAKEKFKLWETVFLKLFDDLVKQNGVQDLLKEKSYARLIRRLRQKF